MTKLSRPSANLHGVFFLTKEEGWAVGQLGKIFHTTDGGKSWEEQHSGTNLLLTADDFVDRARGWIVGERGIILASDDGGATWHVQQSGITYPLFDVDFTDRETGWAVGHWGTMLFTEDGGKRWVERSLALDLHEAKGPIDPAVLHDVVDPQSGEIIVKAGQLLTKELIAEMTRRGIHGVRVREDVVLNAIFFLDQAHGWVAGERGLLLRTADGGRQWEKITLPRPPRSSDEVVEDEMMSEEELEAFGVISPPPSLYGVYFVSPQQGWVVGQDGTVGHTRDGGETWEFQPVATREALYDVGIVGETGWIVGDKGTVLVSVDGGTTWERKELGLEYRLSWLRRLAVIPGNHSFLVGADGLVFASGQSPGQGLWLRQPTQQ
ncbi:MAG: YCF48-related protein [Thermodesulfobacteriota bacterium]